MGVDSIFDASEAASIDSGATEVGELFGVLEAEGALSHDRAESRRR